MLSQQAKYLWLLLDSRWGAGYTVKQLVEDFGYEVEEVDLLIKELKREHLVKDFTEYGTTYRGWRAQFDRKGLIKPEERDTTYDN